MGEKSPAEFLIVALLLSTAVLSFISVLYVAIAGYSAETFYAVSFVIIQVAFFCIVSYVIIRIKEWINSQAVIRERYLSELNEIKRAVEFLRKDIEHINKKADNLEKILSKKD